MLPVKVHTHVFNITGEEKKWKWDHELTEYYNMKDLRPLSFDQLNDRILVDEKFAVKYHRALRNGGPGSYIEECG